MLLIRPKRHTYPKGRNTGLTIWRLFLGTGHCCIDALVAHTSDSAGIPWSKNNVLPRFGVNLQYIHDFVGVLPPWSNCKSYADATSWMNGNATSHYTCLKDIQCNRRSEKLHSVSSDMSLSSGMFLLRKAQASKDKKSWS